MFVIITKQSKKNHNNLAPTLLGSKAFHCHLQLNQGKMKKINSNFVLSSNGNCLLAFSHILPLNLLEFCFGLQKICGLPMILIQLTVNLKSLKCITQKCCSRLFTDISSKKYPVVHASMIVLLISSLLFTMSMTQLLNCCVYDQCCSKTLLQCCFKVKLKW